MVGQPLPVRKARLTARRCAVALDALAVVALLVAGDLGGQRRPPRREPGRPHVAGLHRRRGARLLARAAVARRCAATSCSALVLAWALRLGVYITRRNWGHGEDRRYQAIRARNEPGFALKSLYLVFALQAVLAWIVAAPFLVGMAGGGRSARSMRSALRSPPSALAFEAIGDAQMARFKARRGEPRRGHGPRPLALHAPPELLRRGVRLVGPGADGARGRRRRRRLVPGVAAADDGPAAQGLRRQPAREGHRRATSRRTATTSSGRRRFFPAGRARGPESIALPRTSIMQRNRLASPSAPASPPPCSAPAPARRAARSRRLALAVDVDLARFMGDWYVIAAIPTVFERNAHNPIDSYRLDADGSVATTFSFNDGALRRRAQATTASRGFVVAGTGNAVWGQQYVWPIRADYRIAYLAADYSQVVVAREKRDYVWIMARTPRSPPPTSTGSPPSSRRRATTRAGCDACRRRPPMQRRSLS